MIPQTINYQVIYTDGVENQTVFDNQVFSDLTKGVATPAFSGTPSREGYKFIGWTPTVSEFVEGDMTYTAQWEKLPKIIEPVSPPIKQAEVKKVSETVKTTEITKAITKVMNKEQVTYTKTPINHSRKVRQLPKTAEQSMYSNILVGLGMIIVFIVAIYWLKRSKSEGSR
uniref:LPXTG cell wall anchor domain-containing protein n=1 Tax=Enterococcus mundtii TaxID=53346 RepID=UPI0021B0DAA3|nr:LPXTG cell wall anchor domain-containing protein [Enterococcus mundtii]